MESLEYLVPVFGSTILGLIGSIIGKHKGRTGAGFLFGALLGPIGWMVIWLGPNMRSRKCPFCAEWVQPDARVCKHCRRDIVPGAPSRASAASGSTAAPPTVDGTIQQYERWKKSKGW